MPDGRETKFDIVDHCGSVVILPIDDEGNLLFVRQFRHAVGETFLSFRQERATLRNRMSNAPRVRSAKRRAWKQGVC